MHIQVLHIVELHSKVKKNPEVINMRCQERVLYLARVHEASQEGALGRRQKVLPVRRKPCRATV